MVINGVVVLNTLIMVGVVISAVLAVVFDSLLASIIALGVIGALAALEFLLLQAPDVALAEAAVGAVLSTTIFIIALGKITAGRKGEEQE